MIINHSRDKDVRVTSTIKYRSWVMMFSFFSDTRTKKRGKFTSFERHLRGFAACTVRLCNVLYGFTAVVKYNFIQLYDEIKLRKFGPLSGIIRTTVRCVKFSSTSQ